MASDFSISTLLSLSKEEHQSILIDKKTCENDSENVEQENEEKIDSPKEKTSTSADTEYSGLETRYTAEYTTIVIPRKESKPRRKRTAFSNIQLYFLEQFFQKKAYPSSHERNFIASILNIGSGQVKTWFQNRRTKWKKSNFADFEKHSFNESSVVGNRLWPAICSPVVWTPSLPAVHGTSTVIPSNPNITSHCFY